MEDKILVYNKNKFNVGVYKSGGTVGVNIPAGSYVPMTQDDIMWIHHTSSMFSSGFLQVDKEHEHLLIEMGEDPNQNPNILSDKDIETNLKKTPRQIDKWMSEITQEFALDKIGEMALKLDLPKSKLDVVGKYVNLELKADVD